MRTNFSLLTILILSLALTVTVKSAHSSEITSNLASVTLLPINNISRANEYHFSGGQLSQKELSALANLGIKHIINLRPISEQTWDEQTYVESLDLSYHSLPVAGISDLNNNNAQKLEALLSKLSDEGVYVHCASGNRVGALVALHKGKTTGEVEPAIAEGKRWGLTRLEHVVRKKLMP